MGDALTELSFNSSATTGLGLEKKKYIILIIKPSKFRVIVPNKTLHNSLNDDNKLGRRGQTKVY